MSPGIVSHKGFPRKKKLLNGSRKKHHQFFQGKSPPVVLAKKGSFGISEPDSVTVGTRVDPCFRNPGNRAFANRMTGMARLTKQACGLFRISHTFQTKDRVRQTHETRDKKSHSTMQMTKRVPTGFGDSSLAAPSPLPLLPFLSHVCLPLRLPVLGGMASLPKLFLTRLKSVEDRGLRFMNGERDMCKTITLGPCYNRSIAKQLWLNKLLDELFFCFYQIGKRRKRPKFMECSTRSENCLPIS